MFQALATTLVPNKKIKTKPTSTVTSGAIATTSVQDPTAATFSLDMNNENSNFSTIDLDQLNKCDLIQFDPEEDKILSQILTQTEKDLGLSTDVRLNAGGDCPEVKTTNSVTNVQNNSLKQSSMPIVPRMYFPNSHVTINYNIIKK